MDIKGYLAVVLDKQSHLELKKLARHDKIHCHHVTLAFNVNKEDVEEQEGKFVTMLSRWLYFDDKAAAVTVQLGDETTYLFQDKYAHVTLSTAKGIKPSYSNKLIDGTEQCIEALGSIPLSGTVKFVPFDPQPIEFEGQEKLRIAASREKEKPVLPEVETCCGGIPLYKGVCPVCGDK